MNLIFTCGGTAGHINPAIAVANMMKERDPDGKILFIGAVGHMEEKLVPQAGFEVKCLPGSGLSRKLNVAGIKKNLYAVRNSMLSLIVVCRKFSQMRAQILQVLSLTAFRLPRQENPM